LNQSSTEPPIREASSSSSRRSREDRSDHPMRLLLEAWGNSANRGTSGVASMFVCPNENNSQKLENKR